MQCCSMSLICLLNSAKMLHTAKYSQDLERPKRMVLHALGTDGERSVTVALQKGHCIP